MKLSRWLRVIHRDLGFFLVGMTLVYGISGILLNHLGQKNPAFHTESRTIQLPVNLSETELSAAWNMGNILPVKVGKNLPTLKTVRRIDENRIRLFLDGGTGIYNSSTGDLNYEKHTKRVLIYWINQLHYNKVNNWSFVADFYAGALIFLALTGLFIVKGKRSIAGSGKWYLLIGILIPVLFGILFLK